MSVFATSSNHRVWSRFNFQLRLAHLLNIASISKEIDELLTLKFEEGTRAQIREQATTGYQRALTLVVTVYGADSLHLRNLQEARDKALTTEKIRIS